MQAWLKGINTDISKVTTALSDARQCKDVDQRQMYTKRFKESEEMLKKYRGVFEKALAQGKAPPKEEMQDAEKKVTETKTSLSAWSKLKSILMT